MRLLPTNNSKNIRIILNAIVLFILITPVTIYALTINIDGNESDWMPSNWICPGGTGCSITGMSDNSVWLCCDQYPNQTKCQLMWKDRSGDTPAVIDIIYVRFYANSSGLYIYMVARNPFQHQNNIVVQFCGTTITINIGNPPATVTFITIRRSKDDYALEMKIPLAVAQSGSCVFGIGLSQSGNTENPRIITEARTITTVNLYVSGGYVVGGFYDSIPIPVPEPWYISMVVLISISITLLVALKKFNI